MSKSLSEINTIFFGTPDIAVAALDEMEKKGLRPIAVVTAPDRRAGRGMEKTPPPAKVWANERGIEVLQPERIDEDFITLFQERSPDVAIVAAYGKILPKELLDIPPHGFLNIHPSLLPAYRGAAPIESALLAGEEKTGVTIMAVDEQMDHGPIVSQRAVHIHEETAQQLREMLGRIGAQLIIETLPDWVSGTLKPIVQNHDEATYTKKIQKEDGKLDLSGDPEENMRKVRALAENPGTFCFVKKGDKEIRVAVKDAEIRDGEFVITRATPEGKKEMDEREFQNWLNPALRNKLSAG